MIFCDKTSKILRQPKRHTLITIILKVNTVTASHIQNVLLSAFLLHCHPCFHFGVVHLTVLYKSDKEKPVKVMLELSGKQQYGNICLLLLFCGVFKSIFSFKEHIHVCCTFRCSSSCCYREKDIYICIFYQNWKCREYPITCTMFSQFLLIELFLFISQPFGSLVSWAFVVPKSALEIKCYQALFISASGPCNVFHRQRVTLKNQFMDLFFLQAMLMFNRILDCAASWLWQKSKSCWFFTSSCLLSAFSSVQFMKQSLLLVRCTLTWKVSFRYQQNEKQLVF